MITVIADDFTGAAEISGLGLRYGLKTVFLTSNQNNFTDCDLLVLATNMRAKTEQTAMQKFKALANLVSNLQPELIYLKVDSVLRGHVYATLRYGLKVFQKDLALLLPANPSLNRTIENGIYYYEGKPLMESGFFKNEISQSSHVSDLLKVEKDVPIESKSVEEILPGQGIVIGDVTDFRNLKNWSKKINKKTLLAGGADFFSAILESNGYQASDKIEDFEFGKNRFFVCGSANQSSKKFIQKITNQGFKVHFMPKLLLVDSLNQALLKRWAHEIMHQIDERKFAIAAIDQLEVENTANLPEEIENAFAQLTKHVCKHIEIEELNIEGGATAFAIIQELEIDQFVPKQELETGVVRMEINDTTNKHITVKPGSYRWPEQLWNFTNHFN